MPGPTIICSVIVDAEAEDAAKALVQPLIERSGFELQRLRWEPHPKTGKHSRLWVWLRMPDGVSGEDVLTAVTDICWELVGRADIGATPHNHAEGDDGSFSDERIIDGTKIPIADPGVLWIHVEALYARGP